jgi:SEC-C motif
LSDSRSGVNESEEFLAALCQKSFLRLWSYANPFKDDGKEFCDIIAVFDNHVFIFFDRRKHLRAIDPNEDPTVSWERWRRATIDRQIKTALGAEKYLRSGRPIFLDAKKTRPLPVKIDLHSANVHKIIVAHGAAEACKNYSDANVSGSLAICYAKRGEHPPFSVPFFVNLDREDFIHLFDSSNLPVLLSELDTAKDFADYLDAKKESIKKYDMLLYCGEEDLLAHYLFNYAKRRGHFIGVPNEESGCLNIGEGEWQYFKEQDFYGRTKKENEQSYIWDKLINQTAENWLHGQLLGDADLLARPNAIFEMAREPRFMRREIVKHMGEAIRQFTPAKGITRHLRFFKSFYSGTAYVFLQLWVPEEIRGSDEEYRLKRTEMLRIACGAAKNKFSELQIVVGIAMDPPKLTRRNSEDFLWLDCSTWSDEQRQEVIESNKLLGFFENAQLKSRKYTEFIGATKDAGASKSRKPGRNDPCPCGSGIKYKRCHGR